MFPGTVIYSPREYVRGGQDGQSAETAMPAQGGTVTIATTVGAFRDSAKSSFAVGVITSSFMSGDLPSGFLGFKSQHGMQKS